MVSYLLPVIFFSCGNKCKSQRARSGLYEEWDSTYHLKNLISSAVDEAV